MPKHFPEPVDREEDYEEEEQESQPWRHRAQPQDRLWACKHCTFDNANHTQQCVMCAQPRDSTPHSAAFQSEQGSPQEDAQSIPFSWTCEVCTYENDSSHSVCVMCAEDLSNHLGMNSQVKFHFKSAKGTKPSKKPAVPVKPASAVPVRFAVERWDPEEQSVVDYKGGASTRLAQINLQCVFGLIRSTDLAVCAAVCKSWQHVLYGPKSTLWKERFNQAVRLVAKPNLGIIPHGLVPSTGRAWARLFGLHHMKRQGTSVDSSMWFPPADEPAAIFSCPGVGSSSLSLVGSLSSAGTLQLWSGRERKLKNHKASAYATPVVGLGEPNTESGVAHRFLGGSICLEVDRAVAYTHQRVVLWDLTGFEQQAEKRFMEALDMKANKSASMKVVFGMDTSLERKRSGADQEEIEWWKEQGHISFCELCTLPNPPAVEVVVHTPNLNLDTSIAKLQLEPSQLEQSLHNTSPQQSQPETSVLPLLDITQGVVRQTSSPTDEWVLINTPASTPIVTSPTATTANGNDETETVSPAEVSGDDQKQPPPDNQLLPESKTAQTQEASDSDEGDEGDAEEEEHQDQSQERISRPFEHVPKEAKRQGLLVLGFNSGHAEIRSADKGKLIARLSFGESKFPVPKFARFTFQLEYPLLLRCDGSTILAVNLEAAVARAERAKVQERLEEEQRQRAEQQIDEATEANTQTTTPSTFSTSTEEKSLSPVLTPLVVECPSKIKFYQLWTSVSGAQSLVTCHLDGNIFLRSLNGHTRERICRLTSPHIGCHHLSNALGLLVVDVRTAIYVLDLSDRDSWISPLIIPTQGASSESLYGFSSLRKIHAEEDYLIMQGLEGLCIYLWHSKFVQCIEREASNFQVCGPNLIVSVRPPQTRESQWALAGSQWRLNHSNPESVENKALGSRTGYIRVLNVLSRARMIKLETTASISTSSSYIPLARPPANTPRTEAVYARKAKKSELSKARKDKQKLVYNAQNRARISKYVDAF